MPWAVINAPDFDLSLLRTYTGMTSSGKMMRDLVCCACGDSSTGGCDSPTCAYGCSPYVSTYPPSYDPRKCHVEDWPLASNGQSYIQAFKSQCPDTYSWQFDNVARTLHSTTAPWLIMTPPCVVMGRHGAIFGKSHELWWALGYRTKPGLG